MASTITTIPGQDEPASKERYCLKSFVSLTLSLSKHMDKHSNRQLIHSIKVGTALLLASLINVVDPLYKQVGENAVWVITTVIIVHEFSAGAMLSKGFNRTIGTMLGGALGCVVILTAQKIGGIGNCIIIGASVFILGAAATYTRMIPGVKKKYDYGVMIFILTFNLVALSGVHCEKVVKLARDRLSTVGMGIGICCFTSLFIFPVWAGEELHNTLASELETLAHCIEGFFEEYFRHNDGKEHQCGEIIDRCKNVLYAKSKDESLANFARWEPWHGNFGHSYPWNKYLQIGDTVRELAAIILSLKGCLQCHGQTTLAWQQSFEEPCEAVAYSIAWTLQELAESIRKMRKCLPLSLINTKLQTMRLELQFVVASSKSSVTDGSDKLEIASLIVLLMTMVAKAEALVKEVEELGQLARFHPR